MKVYVWTGGRTYQYHNFDTYEDGEYTKAVIYGIFTNKEVAEDSAKLFGGYITEVETDRILNDCTEIFEDEGKQIGYLWGSGIEVEYDD